MPNKIKRNDNGYMEFESAGQKYSFENIIRLIEQQDQKFENRLLELSQLNDLKKELYELKVKYEQLKK